MLFSADEITKNLIKKISNLHTGKIQPICLFMRELEPRTKKQEKRIAKKRKDVHPLCAPFVKQGKNIDRSSALCSFEGLFELLQEDILRH